MILPNFLNLNIHNNIKKVRSAFSAMVVLGHFKVTSITDTCVMSIHYLAVRTGFCQSHFYEKKSLKMARAPIQHLCWPNLGYGNHAFCAGSLNIRICVLL